MLVSYLCSKLFQMNIEKLVRFIAPITRNKYLIVISAFLIWVIFLDRDNLIDRYSGMKELNKIEEKKEKQQQQIDRDTESLEKLHDPEYLEKFAREEHLMKKDNEDLYIVVEED